MIIMIEITDNEQLVTDNEQLVFLKLNKEKGNLSGKFDI